MTSRKLSLLFSLALTFSLAFSLKSATADALSRSADSLEVDGGALLPDAPAYAFGFATDSLEVFEGKVSRNEKLTDILLRFNAKPEEIAALNEAANGVVNLSRFPAGKKYLLFYARTPLKRARYLVYEQDLMHDVVIGLEPVAVEIREREVQITRKTAAATVNGPILRSLEAQGVSRALLKRLSEIFAWEVDVLALKRGDQVKVVFEEESVNGKSLGLGKVRAAQVVVKGQTYSAFYFEQDGQGEYYDQTGRNLRRTFLKSPVESAQISSAFSMARLHPVQKVNKPHLGTDYAAPEGEPILAVADGVVEEAGRGIFNGNYVKLEHSQTYSTAYLHMSKIAKGMKRGTPVKQGQVIGYVGSTGLSTGPHVCFRFWKNGQQVDPQKEDFPAVQPLEAKSLPVYYKYQKDMLKVLDGLQLPTGGRRVAA